MDTLSPSQRHINMSHIRSSETAPEIALRKKLFSYGLRYKKNDRSLPGCPDIVMPKYRTVIFVHGCFWHGHIGCKHFRIPKTNTEFWKLKIESNQKRDSIVKEKLITLGWQVIYVWECELKTKPLLDATSKKVIKQILN